MYYVTPMQLRFLLLVLSIWIRWQGDDDDDNYDDVLVVPTQSTTGIVVSMPLTAAPPPQDLLLGYHQYKNGRYNDMVEYSGCSDSSVSSRIVDSVCDEDLQSSNYYFQDSSPLPLNSPKTGSIRALVLLVRFPDHEDRIMPDREHFVQLCNGETGNIAGSMKEYMYLQSYGNYDVSCDVMNWTLTNNTEVNFAGGRSGLFGQVQSSRFFLPVLDALDEEGMDWSRYDSDGDRAIDVLLVFHSGFAAEGGTGINRCLTPPEDRIYSMGFVGNPSRQWRSRDGSMRLGGYAVASALTRCNNAAPARLGIMTHEWLHVLGALDVYDLSINTGQYGGLGSFDIMANPYGVDNTLNLPGSVSPYNKQRVGWITPTEITEDGEYTIRAYNRFPDLYIIRQNYPEGEYLLIENRQALDHDSKLYGSGLLIYHVDSMAPLTANRSWPGQPDWPAKHYKVGLLPADGRYDLERGVNNGDADDFWTEGMRLGTGRSGVWPNTDSYQSGVAIPTGIIIDNISASGMVMTFRVSGLDLSNSPTTIPSRATLWPSMISDTPSSVPTILSTRHGTSLAHIPSSTPDHWLSEEPTSASSLPSIIVSNKPSPAPSHVESEQPSELSLVESNQPSVVPTLQWRSPMPSQDPSSSPSAYPFTEESSLPSFYDSQLPSWHPSVSKKSIGPSGSTIGEQSELPSHNPSNAQESDFPSYTPSEFPTDAFKSELPSYSPSNARESDTPSNFPSIRPSHTKSFVPTQERSVPSHTESDLSLQPSSSAPVDLTIQPSMSAITSDKPSQSPASNPDDLLLPTSNPSLQYPTVAPSTRLLEERAASRSSSPSLLPSPRPITVLANGSLVTTSSPIIEAQSAQISSSTSRLASNMSRIVVIISVLLCF